MQTDNIILLISVTLILSYISTLMYSKTKIPDILWLMGFGLLVGPVLNLFDKGLFLTLAPMMSVVALSVILFEAGINVDITLLLENMGKAAILSLTSIIASILFIGLTLSWMFPADFTLPQAMLLGAMVGGTSTVSVYGIMSGLSKTVKNLSGARVLLTMESIISDPVCIIASITIIRMIMLPEVSLRDSASVHHSLHHHHQDDNAPRGLTKRQRQGYFLCLHCGLALRSRCGVDVGSNSG